MYSWFWILKLTMIGATLFVAYKATYIHKLRSKLWNILFGIFLIYAWIQPITKAAIAKITKTILNTSPAK